ncbi:MAG: YfiR family protein [Bacteroidota bacterium]
MNRVFFFLTILLLGYHATAFGQTLDYKFQSLFVYNIAKYTQWSAIHSSGNLVIGILGNKSIAETFAKSYQDKKIGNQSISIVNYANAADIRYCNILFIPYSTKVDLDNILAYWGNKDVLICTEHEGWGLKGSTVNLVIVDGKIKIEINSASVKKAGIKIASNLTSLATVL